MFFLVYLSIFCHDYMNRPVSIEVHLNMPSTDDCSSWVNLKRRLNRFQARSQRFIGYVTPRKKPDYRAHAHYEKEL